MGLTTREIGSSSFNDMISSIDRRSEFVENRAGANVTTNNALISYGLSNSCSILNAPCGYSNGVYPSLTPIQTFGPELVTNGDFSDGTNGWVGNVNTTLLVSNSQLDIQSINGPGQYGVAFTEVNFVESKKYIVKLDVISTNRPEQIRVGTSSAVITTAPVNIYRSGDIGIGSHETVYKATSTDTYLSIGGRVDMTTLVIDNVSVKEVIDADFDFTRGSSATRVNELGLVQDVQLLSGELVQNGDFKQIGSELVTNGGFDTDSDWLKGTGWTISGGTANCDGSQTSNSSIRQIDIAQVGNIYKITFDLVVYSGFIDYVSLGGWIDITSLTTSGTYTYYTDATTLTNPLTISAKAGFIGSLDNVSVKEVGQNWTVANDDANNYVEFNQEEGTVRLKFLNTSPITTLTSDTQYSSGKKYKLTVDVKEVVSGAVKIDAAGVSQTYNSVGVQEAIIEPTGNANISFYRASSDVDITLNSVSLIEITDDTDLPRINYTNFDYENGEVVPYSGEGSLLLEPQSTNLVTYSEDFTQWTRNTTNIDTPSNVTQTNPSGESESGFININNGVSATKFIYKSISTTSSIHTQSVFFKYHSRQWVQLLSGGTTHYANFDIQNGAVGNVFGCTATIEDYGSGWYKCTATLSSASTPTNIVIAVLDDDATSRLPNSTGTGSYYVWGAQTEALSYATSYIATNGSTVTRLADVCNNSGSSDLINSTEGVLYAEVKALASGTGFRVISLSDGSTSDVVRFYYEPTPNRIAVNLRSNSADVFVRAIPVNDLEYIKIAISYKLNDFKVYVNGIQVRSYTIGNVPIGLKELAFDNGGGYNNFYGNVKCLAVFKEALSDTELQKLTTI